METFGSDNVSLWDEDDGFFYDVLVGADGSTSKVRLRSMVGLLPLIAVITIPAWVDADLPDFTAHRDWLAARRPELLDALVHLADGTEDTLSRPDGRPARAPRPTARGRGGVPRAPWHPLAVRGLSRGHHARSRRSGPRGPLCARRVRQRVFGGNSNWRGPIWMPVNVLLTDALRTHAAGMGSALQLEYPTGSGDFRGLAAVAADLDDRLVSLFRIGADGRRPSDPRHVPTGPLWQAHPTFSEYFHGDTGAGLGASHQTGWTALVAHLICLREI